MFRFAIKNMLIKKVQVILVLLSIVISAGVGVLAFNTAEQVSDGITNTAAYYSAIIGPAGSKTQLAMNTMYFTDSPLGTIPYTVVEELQRDSRVVSAVPFAMADATTGTLWSEQRPRSLRPRRSPTGVCLTTAQRLRSFSARRSRA